MVLRCLIAGGTPIAQRLQVGIAAADSAVRRRTRLVTSARSRALSTPALLSNDSTAPGVARSPSALGAHVAAEVIARMSMRLDTAARLPHWLAFSLW